MAQLQKKINLEQIEAGIVDTVDLAERLTDIDTSISTNASDITALDGRLTTAEGDIDSLEGRMTTAEGEIDTLQSDLLDLGTEAELINLALMSTASAPITSPIFKEIQSYTILDTDIVGGNPTVLTIPNSKTYEVGKNNLTVYRNGLIQFLGVDYTEASSSTISFLDGAVKKDDVVTFEIGASSKLAYNTSATYYTSGDHIGKLETLTYSGDIDRTVTYTYDTSNRISTEVSVEDGVTTTKTYTYNESNQLVSIASVLS